MKHALMALLLVAAAAGPAAAQSWDNSGNNLLNGAYYFRHVFYFCERRRIWGPWRGHRGVRKHNLRRSRELHPEQSCEVADSSVGYLMSCAAWLQYVYGTSATT